MSTNVLALAIGPITRRALTFHVGNILSKLAVDDRTAAVVPAVEYALVT